MSTKIEWCDETWNPVTGCGPISEGCDHCYAQRMLRRNLWDYGTDIAEHYDRLPQPARWKKPRRIFVCSMSDLFHADVTRSMIQNVLLRTDTVGFDHHTYIFLTKRPRRMAEEVDLYQQLVRHSLGPNVWLVVTAENQARADERIPVLLDIPAAVRGVSMEPLLGPIHDGAWYLGTTDAELKYNHRGLDWVIAGPETGPGARPCNPQWIQDVADMCARQKRCAFFDKREDYIRREWPV